MFTETWFPRFKNLEFLRERQDSFLITFAGMTFRQIDQKLTKFAKFNSRKNRFSLGYLYILTFHKICKNRHICAYLILSCFIVTILDTDKELYIYDVYIAEECGRGGGVEICHVFADSIFLYNISIVHFADVGDWEDKKILFLFWRHE